MDKFDFEEYFSDKKNMITLIVLLAILALFVVRNSVSEIQNQWLDEKHSIIAVNELKINEDKKLLNTTLRKITPNSANNGEMIAKCDSLITEIKDYSLKSLYVYYVDFKDPQTTKAKLEELRAFVDENKTTPSHDKIIAEIDDFYKNVEKYKEE